MSRPYSRTSLRLPSTLTSERLCLRPMHAEHVEAMWTMDSDPEVMRHLQPNRLSCDQYHASYLDDLAAGQRFRFIRAIEWRDRRRFVGWVLCRPTEDGLWVEVGYRLTTQAWGQGVATEASKALMQAAIERWNARHFMGVTVIENTGSRNVLCKLGLQYQGQTDAYYGEVLEFFSLEMKP